MEFGRCAKLCARVFCLPPKACSTGAHAYHGEDLHQWPHRDRADQWGDGVHCAGHETSTCCPSASQSGEAALSIYPPTSLIWPIRLEHLKALGLTLLFEIVYHIIMWRQFAKFAIWIYGCQNVGTFIPTCCFRKCLLVVYSPVWEIQTVTLWEIETPAGKTQGLYYMGFPIDGSMLKKWLVSNIAMFQLSSL